jgi:hypothetical protein
MIAQYLLVVVAPPCLPLHCICLLLRWAPRVSVIVMAISEQQQLALVCHRPGHHCVQCRSCHQFGQHLPAFALGGGHNKFLGPFGWHKSLAMRKGWFAFWGPRLPYVFFDWLDSSLLIVVSASAATSSNLLLFDSSSISPDKLTSCTTVARINPFFL